MDEIRNAIIRKVDLDDAGHGFLNCGVHLDYGGSGQCFGGYSLYLPKSYRHRAIKSIAGHFIWRVMEVAGVSSWADVPGKAVRVQIQDQLAIALGHIIRDDWFCPRVDFLEPKASPLAEGDHPV